MQSILSELGVRELPFSAEVGVRLSELRVSTGLTMPYCCVLLAAIDADGTMASFDRRLAEAAQAHGRPTLGG